MIRFKLCISIFIGCFFFPFAVQFQLHNLSQHFERTYTHIYFHSTGSFKPHVVFCMIIPLYCMGFSALTPYYTIKVIWKREVNNQRNTECIVPVVFRKAGNNCCFSLTQGCFGCNGNTCTYPQKARLEKWRQFDQHSDCLKYKQGCS